MNYKLIMTEGSDELAFINVLLKKKLLFCKKEELLMEMPFHKRQIDGELIGYIQQLPYGENVDIYRIGDKLSDKLKNPGLIMKEKINKVIDVCTKPEFEVLFVINEGLYEEYIKYKSEYKVSEYYKRINKEYKKQSNFVHEYFDKMNNEDIIELLKEYQRIRIETHSKNQKSLLDICSF